MNRTTEDNLTSCPPPAVVRDGAAARQSSATATAAATQPALAEIGAALERAGGGEAVIPVVAEELQVERRTVETGRVRVTKLVREQQEVVDQPSTSEEVTVERVPLNRMVDVAPEPRQEGDTMVYPVMEEVVVVERRLMLKEEVRITKRVTETRNPQTVTLRAEDVKIERIAPAADGAGT